MPDSETKLKRPEYPHIPTFVLLLFCGYVVIWYLQIGYRRPALGEIRIEFLWAIGLSVFALIYTKADNFRNPLTPYLILYFIVIIIQVPFSYNPEYSWKIFVDRIIKFAFMAWFIITFVKSPKGLIVFLLAFMFVCLKMGQEGFVGQLSGGLVWQNQGVMRLHGSTPMYAHPNSFSGMAVGTLPFIIAFFPIVNKWLKGLLIVQLIFAINIIIFTGSRTGWVATALLLISVLFKSKKKVRVAIAMCVLLLLAIQYVPKQYIERFESIYTLEETEGRSSQARIQILEDAWYIFLRNPLGIGVASFPFIRDAIFGRNQDTHNLYFEVLTNLGIQGFFVFILLISKMIGLLTKVRHKVQKIRSDTIELSSVEKVNKTDKNYLGTLELLEACAQSVQLYIIVRLGLGLFGMDLYEIYWWFASGMSIALFNITNITEKNVKYNLSMIRT